MDSERKETDFRALLAAAQGGDGDALGHLLDAQREALWTLAQRFLLGPLQQKVSPSDLVQETFLEATRDFSQFRDPGLDDFRRWVRTLLANNLLDAHRRFAASQKRSVQRERSLDDRESRLSLLHAALQEPDPGRQFEDRECAERLNAAIARLKPGMQAIIHWRIREDLSWTEIAERLGRSEGAARMLLTRSLKKLKRMLDGSHGLQ